MVFTSKLVIEVKLDAGTPNPSAKVSVVYNETQILKTFCIVFSYMACGDIKQNAGKQNAGT